MIKKIGEIEARQIYDEARFPFTPSEDEVKRIIAIANGEEYCSDEIEYCLTWLRKTNMIWLSMDSV